jgi:hypothetical protein
MASNGEGGAMEKLIAQYKDLEQGLLEATNETTQIVIYKAMQEIGAEIFAQPFAA